MDYFSAITHFLSAFISRGRQPTDERQCASQLIKRCKSQLMQYSSSSEHFVLMQAQKTDWCSPFFRFSSRSMAYCCLWQAAWRAAQGIASQAKSPQYPYRSFQTSVSSIRSRFKMLRRILRTIVNRPTINQLQLLVVRMKVSQARIKPSANHQLWNVVPALPHFD
jgi:hypothetical protein